MSFPRYPAYKDSGVEWIGEIPVGWGVAPLFSISTENRDKNTGLKSSNTLSLSYGNIIERDKNNNFGLLPDSYETYQIVKFGDIIFRLTDLQNDKNSLRSAISRYNGIITSAYLSIKTANNCCPFYVSYLMRAYDCEKVFYSMGGGVRQSLNFKEFKYLPVILPPLPEQQAIASFLDRECGKIDALIAEQERLIALLAEKRQAVISHAVTKGLNPNAPMKDSGIPWIGMVPEGWTLKPLKSFVTFVGGATPSKDNLLFWNGDIPWVSPKDMKSHHIFDTEDHITKAALSASATRLVPTGNLLIVVRSGILQRTIPVAINSIPVTLNQDMKCIIPQKEICVPDFLFWLIHGFSRELLPIWSKQGATVESLEMEYMQKTIIPLPAIPEQRKIIRFIQHHCRNFNNLIFASSSAITLLKERRAALISAAVTGKIDVRAQSKAIAA